MKAGNSMRVAPYDYILRIVQQTNILPVTSGCGTKCIFCSHKNNPREIEAYTLPRLSFDDIVNMSEFLDGRSKIVIGESASRIIEGEPFFRSDMVDILKYLRGKFPSTVIEITTSGVLLTREIVEELKKLQPLEINISLNSSSIEGRKLLFGGRDLYSAVYGVEMLGQYGIEFHGSIVALPDMVGYEDIENTIAFLCMNKARTVRVFVPGFSGLSEFKIDFFEIRQRLNSIADTMYMKYGVPVLVEPPDFSNLDPAAASVIKGSPAEAGGLLKGDIIIDIDGYAPVTRVDAYNELYKRANPSIRIQRGQTILDINIRKQPGTSSGAIFYYDVNPDSIYSIESAVRRCRSNSPLVVTSRLGFNPIKLGIEKLLGMDMDICVIENNWFGGSIMCTGLLVAEDIIDGLMKYKLNKKPDLIILPPLPFDMNGRDLSGRYYYEIEEAVNVKTVIAE